MPPLARARTLRLLEVKHVAVLLEHVDLIDAADGLDVELLEGSLELLVLASSALGLGCDLATGRTLAA